MTRFLTQLFLGRKLTTPVRASAPALEVQTHLKAGKHKSRDRSKGDGKDGKDR
jgi:hypothetical protein